LSALALLGCTNPSDPVNAAPDEVDGDASSSTGEPPSATSATAPPAAATDPDPSTTTDDTGGPGPSASTGDGGTASSSGEPDATSDGSTTDATSHSSSDGSTGSSGSSGEVFEPFDFDDFDDPGELDDWTLRHEWEGTAAQYTTLDFDVTTPGAMTMIPTTSGWFGDHDGPFVFKLVSGDFIIETYVTVTGVADPDGPPTQTYNSAGLMIRDPANEAMGEDWVIHNTGYQEFGVASEGKITIDSSSILTTSPGAHFGRLRICRFGGDIAVTRWLDGDPGWTDTVAAYPDLLPDEVQAGMAATAWNSTGSTPNYSVDPDMIAIWDYVAFYAIDDMDRCYEG
jgi:hypothetical protein